MSECEKCECVGGVIEKSLPIMVSGIHVDDTEPLPMRCPCPCHEQRAMSEEQKCASCKDIITGTPFDCGAEGIKCEECAVKEFCQFPHIGQSDQQE